MTHDQRILTALLCGPMTSAQIAKALHRSTDRTRLTINGLRHDRLLMVYAVKHFTARTIPTYALTAKGLAAAKELLL